MTPATLSPSSARVKFRLAGGAQPLILLPVHINEAGPFEFILDTGAGTSLLTPERAKQLDVKIIGSKEGQSAGGKVAVSLAKADSLAVGDVKLGDVDLGIVDLSHVGKTIGAKIDGDGGVSDDLSHADRGGGQEAHGNHSRDNVTTEVHLGRLQRRNAAFLSSSRAAFTATKEDRADQIT